MYHSQSLVYRRVPPPLRLHLPRHHLHHRILYLMSTETPKIQYQKWKYEWRASGNPDAWTAETENKNEKEGREDVHSDLLDWLQDFRENVVDEEFFRARGKPGAWISRHFQFFSWITNGVSSRSGTGLWQAQYLYSLPEGGKLRYLLEDENNKVFLQKTCWYIRTQSGTCWWFDHCGSQSSQWRKWITQQSSIRRWSARCGNSVVTISLQIKIFSGNPEEPN